MALIVGNFLDYFIFKRQTARHFDLGEVSYFDPKERCFLRINPSKGDAPQEHWIALPVIKHSEVIKGYLQETDKVEILKSCAVLDEFDFTDKVIALSDEFDFGDDLGKYVTQYYNGMLSKWIEDNHIPNCKLHYPWFPNGAPAWMEGNPERIIAYRRECSLREKLQEEEFKKSLQN